MKRILPPIALVLFVAIGLAVHFGDLTASFDSGVAAALQRVRTPGIDPVMVGLTLLGDTRFVLLCMTLILVALVTIGHWRLVVDTLVVFVLAKAGAPLIKMLVARPRPSAAILDGPVWFSFPSGHAVGGAVILGVLAVLATLAHRGSERTAWTAWTAAIVLATGIAASRVWLNVHWTTDALAGLLFAATLVGWFGMRRDAATEPLPAATTYAIPLVFALLYFGYATLYGPPSARYYEDLRRQTIPSYSPTDSLSQRSPFAVRSAKPVQ